ALQRNTWVHLACHEKQDREQPYNSQFAMKDKSLTLLDHTAVCDEETADEVIHLAVGLQFSGFKSVM
ncbi:hypothetical protein CY34DRAFT_45068, partial [Suillus luteus UH-Slu-Lm8-n1]